MSFDQCEAFQEQVFPTGSKGFFFLFAGDTTKVIEFYIIAVVFKLSTKK